MFKFTPRVKTELKNPTNCEPIYTILDNDETGSDKSNFLHTFSDGLPEQVNKNTNENELGRILWISIAAEKFSDKYL